MLPFALHCEVTADGASVVMVAAGDAQLAAKHLTTLVPTLSPTKPRGGLTAPLTWPLIIQLAATLGPAYRPGERLLAWTREEFGRRYAPAAQSGRIASRLALYAGGWLKHDAPKPRDYQWEGAELIARTGRALVFDDPGTGKTLTAILGVLLRLQPVPGTCDPLLVVCPTSVVDSWVEAWQRWTSLSVAAYRGTPARRQALLRGGGVDVLVSGYATARVDQERLTGARPSAVIVDECHWIKNPASQQSKAVRAIARQADAVVAMSGTPITHHVGDLFPALNAIQPAAWRSRERFTQRYLLTSQGDYREEVLGFAPGMEPEFRDTLLGAHRRVAKADVLSQLPPKVYSVRTVELPPEHRRAYDQMERDMVAELPDGTELPAMEVITQLQRLLQLANSACDVETTTVVEEDPRTLLPVEKVKIKVTPKLPSWKVDALHEVLAEREGRQTLVFAPSATLIKLAAASVSSQQRTGLIVGGQSATSRAETVAAFQAGELDVLCLTTGAGGVGLTLTAADTVVFLQRPWSFVEASQAEDRAHRIGSERHESVEIIDIVANKTVDSYIRSILREKGGTLADLLQDHRIATEVLGGLR